MTALIVLDEIKAGHLKPDQMIPIYPESKILPDSKFAVVGLSKDLKEIPVHAALTQLLQLSSNTMARNLAIAVAGSSEKFVSMMNAKANAWEMHDTHFENEHGLPVGDRKSEHTTAKDLTVLAGRMIPYLDTLKSYTYAPLTYWQLPTTNPKHPQKNSDKDKLALIDEGALIKTGTIDECQSLLTVLPVRDVVVVDVQLCAKKHSRFKNALVSLRNAFHKIPDMFISHANATPNVVKQSSPPAPPSID
jgi:D-alanyl-D-alanine carboxypeptidase